MTFEQIQKSLQNPLPGKQAHLAMAPETRIESLLSETPEKIASAKKAAVLLLLYELAETFTTVFIKRTVYDGVHSGQIAFPGGRYEFSDKDLIFTALRETEEEVGVCKEKIEVLGCLTPLYIPPSNFLILPVVGITRTPPNFVLQADEVADVLQVPLDILFDKKNKSSTTITSMHYGTFSAPCYNIQNEKIWGATAMVINEFQQIIESK